MRIPKHFRLYFERHWLQVGDISQRWYVDAQRTAWCGYRKGREDERKLHNKILASMVRRIDALEAEIKQDYIDEIITACSGGDGLLDSACTNSRAVGLRKLAEWGIVTIEQDYGRRVIAHLNEG